MQPWQLPGGLDRVWDISVIGCAIFPLSAHVLPSQLLTGGLKEQEDLPTEGLQTQRPR